ncbi:N-acyl-D-amino-acid deacylase family protein [Mesobacterium pallidum]|uniref:N-acyl-D-amino-acid deacylase family protein n=1 Tax=Mesobacterium pallidum TaxID=2872037 RepID=UPI001EE38CC4|nr:D-aminoacylase [Mesobacterium pallidum]
MTRADLLIRDATVHDGSGAPGRVLDVAVTGDRIVAIGPRLDIAVAEVIDAAGLVLAPGFIDVHTHDDIAVLTRAGSTPKVSQGVTTVVTGNCGISAAPSPLLRRDVPVPPLDLLGDAATFAYPRFADYLAAVSAAGPAVNVVPLVGHTALRARAMDSLDRPATDEEIAAMRRDLVDALEAGAIGLSTGLAYPPAKATATAELIALVGDVAAAGALWTTHMRDERSGVVSAVAETIDIARRTGSRTLISHHKCCGEAAFGLSQTTLSMIAEARAELTLDLDVYPYTASSTVLIETFARDSRQVTVTWSDPHPEMNGRDLGDVSAEWGLSQTETIERLKPGGAIYHQMDDGDLDRILAFPPSLVGSDGLPRDRRPHPRLWGTFPRVLGHFSRDRGLIPLETAIAKMTGQTARVLGLTDRGLVQEGYYADLVLFDPGTVIDTASYDDPTARATGIHTVWVNGKPSWSDGAPADAGIGKLLTR